MTIGDDRLARVLRTCEEALALPGPERLAFLDAACGPDADLRREVDTLLARRDDSRDGFLDTPPWLRPAPVLAAGQRLGPYEVTGPLGAGGMGAVYRARDTRLARTVALKVIAGDGQIDAAIRERFTQEARAIAATNHPNICAIYDVGRDVPSGNDAAREIAGTESRPIDFLVMEYLEGQTLAERLAAGPLPIGEALQVGIHVADALSAAHDQGIVHGDLKPANVMLTGPAGRPVAKLLDFGLSEAAPPRKPAGGRRGGRAAADPSRPRRAVRGTVPYMAPEQLDGREPDTRTDLFAFGSVLFEMLTGRCAFAGDTEASIVTAIRNAEPPAPSTLEPPIPAALDRLVSKCLAKEPDERWQTAREVADRLRAIWEAEIEPTGTIRRLASHAAWLSVGALLIVTAGALAAWGVWRFRPETPPASRTFVLPAPEGVAIGGLQGVQFSADGRAVVYWGTKKNVPAIYWHNLSETDARLVAGTESPGARSVVPFVSPDGGWLGVARPGELAELPIRPGQAAATGPLPITADGVAWVRGVSWGEGGTIVYCPTPYSGLWRVSASGGPPRELTRPDPSRAEGSHCWPQVLPGGRAALFTIKHASGRQDRSAIALVELESGRITRLVEGGAYPRYAPSGHIVYARDGSLLAVPFNLASLSIAGRPVHVLSGVAMESKGDGSARFAISRDGALVYEPVVPRPEAKNALVWVDRDGQAAPVTPDERAYTSSLGLSPGGRTLVVRIEDSVRLDSQLWAWDVQERRWQQLTSEGENSAPVWSPKGDRIAFGSNRDGAFNLYVMAADGDRRLERLTWSPHWQYPSSWSPDGRLLVYMEQEPGSTNLWIVALDGDRKPRRWGPENVNAIGASFSPDGRWITYQSHESGRPEVYVRPLSGEGPRLRVSGATGGMAPTWSPDGRSVLYLDGPKVMAAKVESWTPLRLSAPHLAFALPFPLNTAGAAIKVFAPSPDGQHLAVMRPDPATYPQNHRLIVVTNWIEELKRKVPSVR